MWVSFLIFLLKRLVSSQTTLPRLKLSKNGYSNTLGRRCSRYFSNRTLKKFGQQTRQNWLRIGWALGLRSCHKRSWRSCAQWTRKSWWMQTSGGDPMRTSTFQNTEESGMCGSRWRESSRTNGSGTITRWTDSLRVQSYFVLQVTGVNHKKKTVEVKRKGEETGRVELSYDILLNTSPIDQLINHTQLTAPLDIMRSKVFVVGVGLRKPMTPFLETITWLYMPDLAVPFFRVTVLSRYGEVTPDGEKYWSLMCECAVPIDDPASWCDGWMTEILFFFR